MGKLAKTLLIAEGGGGHQSHPIRIPTEDIATKTATSVDTWQEKRSFCRFR
jgi:hypothetical protein